MIGKPLCVAVAAFCFLVCVDAQGSTASATSKTSGSGTGGHSSVSSGQPAAVNCSTYTAGGCDECTGDSGCVWCDSQCVAGGWTGPDQGSFFDCGSGQWYWTQCSVTGAVALYIALGLTAGLALISFFLICCCCCCRKRCCKSKKDFAPLDAASGESVIGDSSSRRRKGKDHESEYAKKREEIRKKYNLPDRSKKDTTDAELDDLP
ncbi:hypothetical protein Pelo_338 [Pelomyxa schiedti]|nr:hypothetical protein Pelo_338 [Pelomyxa schiedti]